MKVFVSYYFKKKLTQGVGNVVCDIHNYTDYNETVREAEKQIKKLCNAKSVVALSFNVLEG